LCSVHTSYIAHCTLRANSSRVFVKFEIRNVVFDSFRTNVFFSTLPVPFSGPVTCTPQHGVLCYIASFALPFFFASSKNRIWHFFFAWPFSSFGCDLPHPVIAVVAPRYLVFCLVQKSHPFSSFRCDLPRPVVTVVVPFLSLSFPFR